MIHLFIEISQRDWSCILFNLDPLVDEVVYFPRFHSQFYTVTFMALWHNRRLIYIGGEHENTGIELYNFRQENGKYSSQLIAVLNAPAMCAVWTHNLSDDRLEISVDKILRPFDHPHIWIWFVLKLSFFPTWNIQKHLIMIDCSINLWLLNVRCQSNLQRKELVKGMLQNGL